MERSERSQPENTRQKHENKLEILRELLLEREQQKRRLIKSNVSQLEGVVGDLQDDMASVKSGEMTDPNFGDKVAPYFSAYTKDVQENFDRYYGDLLAQAIKVHVRSSRQEVVDALYPIVGSLISRYVRAEIAKLRQDLDRTASKMRTAAYWRLRLKGFITGVDYSDMMLEQVYQSTIDDIFIIDKSGILLAKLVLEENEIDQDKVAAALTSIKDFALSTFSRRRPADLQKIDCGEYSIVLQSFNRFYFAVLCSGVVGEHFQDELNKKIINFSNKYLTAIPRDISQSYFEDISSKLQNHF